MSCLDRSEARFEIGVEHPGSLDQGADKWYSQEGRWILTNFKVNHFASILSLVLMVTAGWAVVIPKLSPDEVEGQIREVLTELRSSLAEDPAGEDAEKYLNRARLPIDAIQPYFYGVPGALHQHSLAREARVAEVESWVSEYESELLEVLKVSARSNSPTNAAVRILYFARPTSAVRDEASYASEFSIFDGAPRARLSINKEFAARPDSVCPWQQIYAVAPGCFALSEEAWEECEVMYYVLSMGRELLAAGDAEYFFRIYNSLEFAPPSDDSARPFDLGSFYAPIFRLRGRDPTELYCLSGTQVPGDEFKFCYDQFGFRGFVFEEVWSSE